MLLLTKVNIYTVYQFDFVTAQIHLKLQISSSTATAHYAAVCISRVVLHGTHKVQPASRNDAH